MMKCKGKILPQTKLHGGVCTDSRWIFKPLEYEKEAAVWKDKLLAVMLTNANIAWHIITLMVSLSFLFRSVTWSKTNIVVGFPPRVCFLLSLSLSTRGLRVSYLKVVCISNSLSFVSVCSKHTYKTAARFHSQAGTHQHFSPIPTASTNLPVFDTKKAICIRDWQGEVSLKQIAPHVGT